MSKYMTDQKFAWQRASVGRVVLLAAKKHDGSDGVCLRAGMIIAISSKDDRPYIHDIAAGTCDWKEPAWTFFDTHSFRNAPRLTPDASGPNTVERDVETLALMPIGSWTWPPHV